MEWVSMVVAVRARQTKAVMVRRRQTRAMSMIVKYNIIVMSATALQYRYQFYIWSCNLHPI